MFALILFVLATTGIVPIFFKVTKRFVINDTLTQVLITISNILFSFSISLALFSIIYKIVPDPKVHWKESLVGALIAVVAFTFTNYVFEIYTENFTIITIIGTAGSLMILSLWLYLINQIVLYGAEVSKVYAVTFGKYSKENLPPEAEKLVKPLNEAGKKIEKAAKGKPSKSKRKN